MATQAAPLRELSTTRFIIPTWVVRHSKEVRDEADKRITADPRKQPGPDMPFGGKRRRRRARQAPADHRDDRHGGEPSAPGP